MLQLKRSLSAWKTERFSEVFIQEVMQLRAELLPLQQGLKNGSYAITDDLQIMLNKTTETDDSIVIDCGIFYSSVIAGCNCSDDPSPVDLNNEYCEVAFTINKTTADTEISLLK